MRVMRDFHCDACGEEFEQLIDSKSNVATCPSCGAYADLVFRSVPMIDPKLGVSGDFPTMADKWAKKRRKLATGQMKDANNKHLDARRDHERDAYETRKRYEK